MLRAHATCHLWEMLDDTGDVQLIEANGNESYNTNGPLRGKNVQGKITMGIRTAIRDDRAARREEENKSASGSATEATE